MFKCYYTSKKGERFLAAGKQFKMKAGADRMFKREIDALLQLNHLFIIKYLDLVMMNEKK